MPIELQRYGSMGSISYHGQNVKIEGVPFTKSVEASGGTHVESEDSRSRLPEASEQSIAQASGESNANEAAVLKTTLKRLIEQVSSAPPNRHMRLKNFVQFSQFSSRCFGGTIEAESSDIQEEPHGRKEH